MLFCDKEGCEETSEESRNQAAHVGWISVKLKFVNGIGVNKKTENYYCSTHADYVKNAFFAMKMNRKR